MNMQMSTKFGFWSVVAPELQVTLHRCSLYRILVHCPRLVSPILIHIVALLLFGQIRCTRLAVTTNRLNLRLDPWLLLELGPFGSGPQLAPEPELASVRDLKGIVREAASMSLQRDAP